MTMNEAKKIEEMKRYGILCQICVLKDVKDRCNDEFCGEAYDEYVNSKDDPRVEAEILNRNNDEMPTYARGLFLCDPNKNVECNKKACYINGGNCSCTHHEEFARNQPIMGCRIREATPEEEQRCEEAYEKSEDGELMYEEGETIIVPKDEYRELVHNAHFVNCLTELGFDNTELITKAYEMADKRMADM